VATIEEYFASIQVEQIIAIGDDQVLTPMQNSLLSSFLHFEKDT
jgi:hypothetical protein